MTTDLTPEQAADELAAVSQELGLYDEPTREEPGPFVAPFREVIHNIHQFGEHWSWRCGVVYSRLDLGYLDGACQYDHTVDSWGQLVTDATEHLRRWHGIQPAGHEIPAVEQEDCTGGHAIGCRHIEHPDAPLAEAGHLDVETARDILLHPGGRARSLLAVASEVVVTALDVRGRERDAARADRDVLSRLLRGMTRRLWKHRMAFRQIRRAGAASEHRLGQERAAARAEAHKIGLALGLRPVERIRLDGDAVHDRALGVVAELERLREELRQADEFGRGEFRVTQHAYDQAVRTIGDLRGRGEAAKAVARWWNGLGGCSQAVLRDPRRGFRAGADALDALARAHDAGGQGR